MPKYFTILLSLFLLFFVALSSFSAYIIYDQTRPVSTIGVTDTLKKKIKPDQATVQLFVSQAGTDLAKMNKENDAITLKVTNFLIKNGVITDKIKTNKTSFEEFSGIIETDAKKPKLTRAETTIDVEFVNLDNNPNFLLDQTLALGVSRYGQFNYKTKDVKQFCDALENEVELSVKDKAANKMKNMAGKVIRTQYNQTYTNGCDNMATPVYNMKTALGGANDNSAPELMTGEQEISATASLNLDYR
jgi:uncharacterized protein YggE